MIANRFDECIRQTPTAQKRRADFRMIDAKALLFPTTPLPSPQLPRTRPNRFILLTEGLQQQNHAEVAQQRRDELVFRRRKSEFDGEFAGDDRASDRALPEIRQRRLVAT